MIDEKAVQGTLQRRRLDNAREVYQLLMTNVEELRQAEFRDSDVQTKVRDSWKSEGGKGEGEQTSVGGFFAYSGTAFPTSWVTCYDNPGSHN